MGNIQNVREWLIENDPQGDIPQAVQRQQDRRVPDLLLRDCIKVIYDGYLTEEGGNGDDALEVLVGLYALFGETMPECSCGNPECDGH